MKHNNIESGPSGIHAAVYRHKKYDISIRVCLPVSYFLQLLQAQSKNAAP